MVLPKLFQATPMRWINALGFGVKKVAIAVLGLLSHVLEGLETWVMEAGHLSSTSWVLGSVFVSAILTAWGCFKRYGRAIVHDSGSLAWAAAPYVLMFSTRCMLSSVWHFGQ